MPYKAVLFDLYGTLVDNFTPEAFGRSLDEMAAAAGVPRAEFVAHWGETWARRTGGAFATLEANIEHICREAGVVADPDKITAAAVARARFTIRTLTPRANAIESLSRLRAAGYRTGVISDSTPELPLLWPHLPFATAVDAAVFSSAHGLVKPDPRLYRLAAERLELAPGDCLYVADDPRDLGAAARAGMHPLLLAAGTGAAVDWQGATVTSLPAVVALAGS